MMETYHTLEIRIRERMRSLEREAAQHRLVALASRVRAVPRRLLAAPDCLGCCRQAQAAPAQGA